VSLAKRVPILRRVPRGDCLCKGGTKTILRRLSRRDRRRLARETNHTKTTPRKEPSLYVTQHKHV